MHLSLAARLLSSLPIAHGALVGRRTRSYFLVHHHDYRDGGDEEEDDCEDLVEEEEEVDGAVDTDVGDHKYIS